MRRFHFNVFGIENKDFTHKKYLEHKALIQQADRLPQKYLLTDKYVAMKLYIEYGINLFGITRLDVSL